MEFEVFTGEHGRKFYVFEEGHDWHDVQKELAKLTKYKASDFTCYTGWVERDVNGEDILHFEKVKGAEKVLVAVRGEI